MNGTLIEVETRGLEPPEPMVRILEALASLPPDATVHARTDRRPVHLLPLLTERGFRSETLPLPSHGFLTIIRHPG